MFELRKVFLLLAVNLAISQVRASNLLYGVTPSSEEQSDLLYRLSSEFEGLEVLNLKRVAGVEVRVVVDSVVESKFLDFLEKNQISFKLIEKNLNAILDKEIKEQKFLRNIAGRTVGKGRLSTDRYYSHQEINNYIEDLAKRFSDRVYLKTVGKSFEGRLLKTLTITNGDGRSGKNVILLDGGFHAREWISPASVLYLIEQLVENYEENVDLLLDYDWIILPVVNPDGYEYTQVSATTRMWRKTRQPLEMNGKVCYGTDPNRNFDFHWNEEGSSSNPCSDTFAGPKPFSEPETIVVRDLMHSLKGRGKMYLTLHSFGNYLLYPWGWTTDLPETWKDLDEVARAGGDAIFEATGTEYQIGSSTNVLYIATGASDDYGFYAGFPISITMELPGGGLLGFNPPPSSIDPMVKETWIGIKAMARKVIEKYPIESNTFL